MTPALELLRAWYPAAWRDPLSFPLEDPPTKDASLNLVEASEYTGLTTRRLKDLCRERRITHSRPDYRTYVFKRADLDAWLDQYQIHAR
jgi:excisionase family DNA binding protein